MIRPKLSMPDQFPFEAIIPIRITDLNYGGHVGNDNILSLMHEARVQFLAHYGFSELQQTGIGLIMANVEIEFKSELFYGDQILAKIKAADFSRVGFDIYYHFEKKSGDHKPVVLARTGMVCYNYDLKKIAAVPTEMVFRLSS